MRTLVGWSDGRQHREKRNFNSLRGDSKKPESAVTTIAPGRAQWQLLIRSVKSAFALLLEKVTKQAP